jgi:hypothetical protein
MSKKVGPRPLYPLYTTPGQVATYLGNRTYSSRSPPSRGSSLAHTQGYYIKYRVLP